MSLSRKEFLQHMKSGKVETTVPKKCKAEWDKILKALKRTQAPLTVSQIHTHYVKEVISRYRTLRKLDEWYAQEKCVRIVYKGKYLYVFKVPKDYFKQPGT